MLWAFASCSSLPYLVVHYADGEYVWMQVQFHARGPSGVGRVSADMYKDSNKHWQYLFLYVDADVPVPSRVEIISPGRQL